MCGAPDPPEIKVEKPEFLSNPFLDEGRGGSAMVEALRTGRSDLRVPLSTGLGIGFGGRSGNSTSASGTAGPRGNARSGPDRSGLSTTGTQTTRTQPAGFNPGQRGNLR